MPKILVLTKSHQDIEDMISLLKNVMSFDIHVETNSIHVNRCLKQNFYDIILIHYPFLESKQELLEYRSYLQNHLYLLILMAAKEQCTYLTKAYPSSDMCIIETPMHEETQKQFLVLLKAYAGLIQQFEKRQGMLLRKITEMKFINQAKCLLVQHEAISEQAAHKKIEQAAMNHRKKRYEIAQAIIYKYQRK